MNPLLIAALFLQTGAGTGVLERARVRANAEVSFHAVVAPETVYVGQAARYELGVFIRDDIRQRLRRNPEFVPPDLRALFSYDLREPSGTVFVERNGERYEVHRFRRALYPVAPGVLRVPPARLTYAVPTGASFFSREETRSLQSDAVTIVAIQPPIAGRPATWNGAVGDLTIRTGALPSIARRGDPFVFTVIVAGEGNVGLFPRPELTIAGADVVASDERVRVDSLPDRLTGAKEFDWLVTPMETGTLDLPDVEYPYFDPMARTYRIARASPGAVRVRDADVVAVDTAITSAPVVRGPTPSAQWGRARWPDPTGTWWYWTLVVLAPMPALRRRWQRRSRVVGELSARERLQRAARSVTTAERRRLFVAAVEERLGAAVPWTDREATVRALRRAGVTSDTAGRVADVVARLDAVSYGPTSDDLEAPSVVTLQEIAHAVQGEAVRSRARPTAAVAALVWCALVSGAAIDAQAPRTPAVAFADGVSRIATDPKAAAADFFTAAQRAPRVSVAWRNAAIASWLAADTARAVVGWQRVLRTDPLNSEARSQLRAIGIAGHVARSEVWPVPTTFLAWLGLILWAGAWVSAARGARLRSVAWVSVAALVCVATSVAATRQRRWEDLAIVSAGTPLRALPALGAEAGPTPATGELVVVLERGAVWARVDAGSGRVGWIDARALVGLDGRPLRD